MSDLSALLAVPEGTAILHVGPHKTGTTAIQSALHVARDDLAGQGVRYASRGRHDGDASRYVTGLAVRSRDRSMAEAQWAAVVEALRDDRYPRRIFSSETLANADDEAVGRVLAPLRQVRVVLVARSLVRLIPSQYQQLAQRGAVLDAFLPWVEAVLGEQDGIDTATFWHRHRLDEQIRRWGDRVGRENVTVLVLDEEDRTFLPTAFERLLGVRPGTLAGRAVQLNRSLGADEIDLLRSWHGIAAAAGLNKRQRRELVAPIKRYLHERPAPEPQRLVLPDWAVERATEHSVAIATAVAASGVEVVGDLSTLWQQAIVGT
jgi:hypothetical protein